MAVSTKWKLRWKLLAAGAVVGLGFDLATLSSRPLMVVAVVLVIVGTLSFIATVVGARKEGIVYQKRKEIGLALGTASLTLLLVGIVSIAVRVGPRHLALQNQGYDAALGWAPPDIPEKVGQRGQQIDNSRGHVVTIGDSILYGHGVSDTETAAVALEELLDGHQVLNLAVSGYSIDQYYVYLKRVLPTVSPKLVIVGIFAGNDYEITGLEYGWGHTKPLFRVEGGDLVLHNSNLLADNCIDHLAQSLLFRVLWGDKDRALDLIHLFCDPAKLRPEALEQVIAKIFKSVEDDAHAHGVEVLFVLLPLSNHLRMWEREWTYRNKYTRLRQLLEDGQHEYYEFYPDIVRAVGVHDRGSIFLDGAHYTPRGHELLAASLARVIQERDLLLD